jgi:hypothetical protein
MRRTGYASWAHPLPLPSLEDSLNGVEEFSIGDSSPWSKMQSWRLLTFVDSARDSWSTRQFLFEPCSRQLYRRF